jgi:hypothetical protein
MSTLICKGKDIRFTILSYYLDTPIESELNAHPSNVVGYITYNKETGERKFTYTTQGSGEAHWSVDILNELPYCKEKCPWIVYSCSPEQTRIEFNKILSKTYQTLHIYNWDTWSVSDTSNVSVITSWEIF